MNNQLQDDVNKVFTEAFGRTPLKQRLDDILGEAIELSRCVDFMKVREELSDLLASAIQLANEASWDYESLVRETLAKIERRKVQYHTLGRKTQVAILGGAFNPVTNGHIQTAKFILNSSKTFDEVWLMPCYGHMHGKQMATPEQRLLMCQMAAQVDARIKVFDFEIQNKLQGETYQTVKLLQETEMAKDKYNFSMVIGMDNAKTFDRWVNYEHLEKLIRFVVVPRKGYEFDPTITWFLKAPHIYIAEDNPIDEISSTQIRNWVHEDKQTLLAKYLHPNVFEYIENNKLYE
jgi:nicotinate-nucleotide adenylyltransferase